MAFPRFQAEAWGVERERSQTFAFSSGHKYGVHQQQGMPLREVDYVDEAHSAVDHRNRRNPRFLQVLISATSGISALR